MESESSTTESDPRFPSGPWKGYFLYGHDTTRHAMELRLHFCSGIMSGEGADSVGSFSIVGNYDVETGHCQWVKQYHGRHSVHYRGFNEGKGIWGTWKIFSEGFLYRGGFHIWPEGMSDPTRQHEREQLEEPIEIVTPKRRRRRRHRRQKQMT